MMLLQKLLCNGLVRIELKSVIFATNTGHALVIIIRIGQNWLSCHNLLPLLKRYQMSRCVTFKLIGNHRQGDHKVSIEIYRRGKICIIKISILMLIR